MKQLSFYEQLETMTPRAIIDFFVEKGDTITDEEYLGCFQSYRDKTGDPFPIREALAKMGLTKLKENISAEKPTYNINIDFEQWVAELNTPAFAGITHAGYTTGLTKREYIASMAMQALIKAVPHADPIKYRDLIISTSIDFATSLIEKLNK